MNGKVFDIRRFSTHDGEGIRTTVFLKGCPLSCVWCQNPEGIAPEIMPIYFENRCIHCETCVALSQNGGCSCAEGKIRLNRTAEEDWDKLIYECPSGALEMDAKNMTVQEVMGEIRKDVAFFRHGGGVTLSGGEPLMQYQFAAEILKACQEEGIHTALESSLYASEKAFRTVLPHLSISFADLKLIDDEAHKKYVGVSNERIKKNIEILLTSEIRENVIIRTPMIPGITTDQDNIMEIASFISQIYPDVKYEILNYNPLAEAKYHLVEREFCFKEKKPKYSAEMMEQFKKWAQDAGVKNVIIES